MRECPAVAAQEIKKLQADGFVLSLDDIVWLACLGDRVEHPQGAVNPFTAHAPVNVGNVQLYAMTIQGGMILDVILASDWVTERMYTYCLAWILAEGRTEGAFDGINSKAAVGIAINSFRRKCTATEVEIAEAVAMFINDDAPDDGREATADRTRQDYQKYLAALEAAGGQPARSWYTRTMQEGHALLSAAAILRHGGQGEDVKADIRSAMRDLLRAVNEIRNREQEAGNGAA